MSSVTVTSDNSEIGHKAASWEVDPEGHLHLMSGQGAPVATYSRGSWTNVVATGVAGEPPLSDHMQGAAASGYRKMIAAAHEAGWQAAMAYMQHCPTVTER